mmetsp:Transcript_26141/g.74974  ORF Transcript_26141/g.74974 Transcript_26141/m.74974 type:complete len:261 (+) Transcript_26141:2303-3085(+)
MVHVALDDREDQLPDLLAQPRAQGVGLEVVEAAVDALAPGVEHRLPDAGPLPPVREGREPLHLLPQLLLHGVVLLTELAQSLLESFELHAEGQCMPVHLVRPLLHEARALVVHAGRPRALPVLEVKLQAFHGLEELGAMLRQVLRLLLQLRPQLPAAPPAAPPLQQRRGRHPQAGHGRGAPPRGHRAGLQGDEAWLAGGLHVSVRGRQSRAGREGTPLVAVRRRHGPLVKALVGLLAVGLRLLPGRELRVEVGGPRTLPC